jgi:hypothetical protein
MMRDYPIREDDETVALRLVGWIVADSARADRMLGLTGLDPASLRSSLSDKATLCALMDFVIGHEPDLLACAEDLEIRPADIVSARQRIGG